MSHCQKLRKINLNSQCFAISGIIDGKITVRRFGSFRCNVGPSLNTTMLAIKVGGRDLWEISENGIFAYRTPNSMRRPGLRMEKLSVNVADVSFNAQ